MKKIYSFALIILSIFSGILFSACAGQYNNLKIDVYSSKGEIVENVRLVIDENESTETLNIKFKNIDEDDVGQIVVYSVPNNLITVSNYRYNRNTCSVDVSANASSKNGAKLVVSHLASGKKKEIPLIVDQKSNNVEIYQSKYVVSIPDKNIEKRYVDLNKTYDLQPNGSTDKLYFKVDESVIVRSDNSVIGCEGVKLLPLEDVEGLDDVYVGFEVANTVLETSTIKIYPVTYLEDYETYEQVENQDQYEDKTISVYFKKLLTEENVKLLSGFNVDKNNIQLIANDESLNSYKFSLQYLGANLQNPDDDMLLNSGNFFDMYEIEYYVPDQAYANKVSVFVDAKNDVYVTAHTYTEKPVDLVLVLNPINCVGDVRPVEIPVKVKGDLKSNKIEVLKNGELISTSEKINIFDYYESGTSFGALFTFNPGSDVHKDLNKMRIVVDPAILCEENCSGALPSGVNANSMLYSLMFNLVDDYMKFTYNEELEAMVSEEIDSFTKVYIKYVNGAGTDEPTDFGISVITINKSILEYWKPLKETEISLDFNRLEGVKSMELQAGYYYVDETTGFGNYNIYTGADILEYVYLNRLEGLDNPSEDIYTNFIYVADNVMGADDVLIDKVDLTVKIQPLKSVTNPLTLKGERCVKDDGDVYNEGEQTLTYSYNRNVTNDVLGLVYRRDTSLGDYKISFYQENIEKASVICRVYESLDSLNLENVSLETNKMAFKNELYQEQYLSDYIVASGQNLNVSIDIEQAVLDSDIVEEYAFDFKVGLSDGSTVLEIEGEKTEYFNVIHDSANSNFAKLQFKKGTYIVDGPKYVYLKISVKENVYENIITPASELKETSVEISFFIYETIKDEDVTINHTNLLCYPEKFMAIDYTNLSKATLEFSMNADLWNYASNNEIIWNIDGENIVFDEYYDDYSMNGVYAVNYPELKKCEFKFETIVGYDSYTRTIKAYITQFEKIFEVQCVVHVENPIITESLIIESEIFETEDKTPYINLKKGESYKVLAKNISSFGDVTHPEIIIQVANEYGSAYNARSYFEVNQTTSEILVKDIEGEGKFKLIVFAKDALKSVVSSDKSGYNMPSTFLMDEYSEAYFVIDVYLSDGSEENPYLIKNAYDFWEINEIEVNKQAYYLLMSNISLDDVKEPNIIRTIADFNGHILTYNNDIYNIDGIYLDNGMRNLFTNFSGNISNIKFKVEYAYDIEENVLAKSQYLGLFDKNNGTMTNVGAFVRGYANLNGTSEYHFGGLVGENVQKIEYKDDANWKGIVGVDGLIQLKGNAKIYFGGLVGRNIGQIFGCEKETVEGGTNNIVLSVAGGRENTLSQLTINSELSNNSAIGGVVGLNTFNDDVIGVIKNAFVQVVINAETTSNVGGVIGVNRQESSSISIKMTGYAPETVHEDFNGKSIYNVKSASRILAKDNVGGIVGSDLNGIYLECDYQILTQQYKEIALRGNNSVGGIAGNSTSGKFLFCSVMSYSWNYGAINGDVSKVVTNVADIFGQDYIGGIVGNSYSETDENLDPNGNNVNNRVVIVSSSVNAYLQSSINDGEGNIAGILSASNGDAILYNVYFIGKLDGDVNYEEFEFGANAQHLALDNDGSSHYNAVYSLNLESLENGTVTLKQGSFKDDNEFEIKSIVGELPFWWCNENINGGYIFITSDKVANSNSQPIFDLAPDTINVQVKNPKATGLERVLVLDYYDFSIEENITDATLLRIIEKANREQNITSLLNIEATPSSLGTVVINVKSTDSNVVDITYDGRLLINGVGECELIFSSVLNPNAGSVENRTIKVVVDYPITDLHLSTSRTDKNGYVNSGSTQNIAQNSSRQYYAVTNGEYTYDGGKYKHKTKTNLNFNVEVNYVLEPEKELDADFDIIKYLALTGKKSNLSTKTKYVVDIDEKTPFMISVLKKLPNEGDKFTVKVIPYIEIEGVVVGIGSEVTFDLKTLEGVTSVSFSYDDAIIYPNDIAYLNAYLSTDHLLDNNQIADMIKIITNTSNYEFNLNESNITAREYYIKKNEISIGSVSIYVYLDPEDDVIDNIQKIRLRLEFSDIYLEEELNMQLQFEKRPGVVLGSVNYLILPQRINKIEIKNYYYKNISETQTEKVQQDILKPNSFGEMIIDIVPDNGYYDYLEISDITGNEEIVFIQVDENGNSLSLSHDPSSDGKGIKLYDYNLSKNRIYIRTQISNKYSSKMHTIEVRAYSANGTKIASNRKYIDVKMLPEIEVTYMLPDGSDSFVANAKNSVVDNKFLANGVDANFRIKTINANTEPEYTISGDLKGTYELVKISNELYTLKCNSCNSEDIGKKLKLSFKVYSILNNGDFDLAECSIEFTLTNFVIHSVSVNNSVDNSRDREIYGYFNNEINLNFYFDETDISFYNNNTYHDTVYKLGNSYDTTNEDLNQIYGILSALNSGAIDNEYLILNANTKESNQYVPTYTQGQIDFEDVANTQKFQLYANKLTVKEGYNKTTVIENGQQVEKDAPKYLAAAFKLKLERVANKDNWSILTYNSVSSDEDIYYIVDKNYKLNFRKAVPMHEATVITSQEDFQNMTFGERYILKNDIVLTDYTPIDAEILEFDGNGNTIEIRSFAQFEDVELKAGLFAQIYPNMIVKNVKVRYMTDTSDGNGTLGDIKQNSGIEKYADLCNAEIAYTEAKFGGIAAVNNGIITNCVVEGTVALSASVLENKTFATGGNYEIDFNIGGLVAENSSTGYITNSVSKFKVAALANIAGFVHTNEGKIVSCGVEEETTIYGYNVNLGNTIIVDISGFVVDNLGEISMSYVNMLKGDVFTTIGKDIVVNSGTMSAKDFSAGFVSNNVGEITDAYVQMTETGINNNRFAGFVDVNSGTITRAYTFINSGIKASKDDSMFIGQNSGNLVDCIQFVVANDNTIRNDLSSINISYRNEITYYEQHNFAFGDNVSAVWTIQPGTLPKLVSTQEFKFENFKPIDINPIPDTNHEDGIDEIKYSIDSASYGLKGNPIIISDIETWNYYFNSENVINMAGYYRIVRDIDFSGVGDNPTTSNIVFQGNIQGNNMRLNGIMLYLPKDVNQVNNSKITELGLFAKLEGVEDKNIENAVRNLTLNASSIWASSIRSVGVLAGVVENFNLYNITIDAEDVIIVGCNTVGGVAGIIHGEFDMDQISSNIGASGTRASTLNNYSIYMSKNNSYDVNYNLSKVYYAGSVAGILDGYDRTNYDVNNEIRNIDNNYYKVQNVNVNGNISLSGDTVGAAFGFVGEQVLVNKLNVNISGLLSGTEYSGGAVGENRGVLKNAVITIAGDAYKRSQHVSAGAVGFNLGGLVKDVKVEANIIKTDYSHTAGGIVGRNVNGLIVLSHYNGEILSYFTGGIVGANYSDEILTSATTGTGAINEECKQNSNLIPTSQVKYKDGEDVIETNFEAVSISTEALNKIIENSARCYSYKQDNDMTQLSNITVKSRVLGLVVGLNYEENATVSMSGDNRYLIKYESEKVTFNVSTSDNVKYFAEVEDAILKDVSGDDNDVKFTFENVNVLELKAISQPHVIYLVGSTVSSFNSWTNYSNEYILLMVKSA